MKLSKIYILIAIVALVVALPLATVLQNRDNKLKVERSNSQQLQLKIDSVEKQLEQKNLKIEEQKKETEKLNAELQAKAELKRVEAEKVAQAEAERARQASVKLSAGGASYSGGGDCEQYRGLVSQYGWNVNVAMQVMKAESGCNTMAHNTTDNHGVCMGSFGLFQISCHSGAVYDAAQNVSIAWGKYQARGWQPWGVCTSGKVSCY